MHDMKEWTDRFPFSVIVLGDLIPSLKQAPIQNKQKDRKLVGCVFVHFIRNRTLENKGKQTT